MLKPDGKEAADTYSARAGYSEHQTGLAVDVYNLDLPYTSFEETEEFNVDARKRLQVWIHIKIPRR